MNKISTIDNLIRKYNTIIIHRHKRPDFDCLGAQMALKEFLKYNFPAKKIYAVGVDGTQDFGNFVSIDNIDAKEYKDALVITVDTANEIRIEDGSYKLAKEILKLDHHLSKDEDNYGDYNFVFSQSSSTCELLYYIFDKLSQLDNSISINDTIAKFLFYGIYSDTGGFKFPCTKDHTFLAAAALRRYRFDYEDVIKNLTTYDYETMKLVGYAFNNINISNGVGYIYFSQTLQQELKTKPSKVSLIANFLGEISDLKIWVVFNQYPQFIRVNIRSREEFNVEQIASKFGGGGHKNASGATITDEKLIPIIVNDLENLVREE